MTGVEIIGYIGAFCLSVCTIPQAIKCFFEKHAHGLSWMFLILWLVGEIAMMYFTVVTVGWFNPLIFNYVGNMILLVLILKYKIWPQVGKEDVKY